MGFSQARAAVIFFAHGTLAVDLGSVFPCIISVKIFFQDFIASNATTGWLSSWASWLDHHCLFRSVIPSKILFPVNAESVDQ